MVVGGVKGNSLGLTLCNEWNPFEFNGIWVIIGRVMSINDSNGLLKVVMQEIPISIIGSVLVELNSVKVITK